MIRTTCGKLPGPYQTTTTPAKDFLPNPKPKPAGPPTGDGSRKCLTADLARSSARSLTKLASRMLSSDGREMPPRIVGPGKYYLPGLSKNTTVKDVFWVEFKVKWDSGDSVEELKSPGVVPSHRGESSSA